MAVSVVQNENLPFSRVFYNIFKTLFKVCVFLRAPKITGGGELNFVAVLKFGLIWDQFIKADELFNS